MKIDQPQLLPTYQPIKMMQKQSTLPPPTDSPWILGGMVGIVGIWLECHFSESPPKFYSDSNPIPTKFPPFWPESLGSNMWIKFLPGS